MKVAVVSRERIERGLRFLDRRLAVYVRLSRAKADDESIDQSLLALGAVFVSRAEVLDLLQADGDAAEPVETISEVLTSTAWASFVSSLELSDFDLGVLLLALGVECERKYERVFAFLNNDLTRKRPSVGLTLSIWSDSGSLAERWRAFSEDGPLRRLGLIELLSDDGPRSNWSFRLTEGGLLRLLGDEGVLPEQAPFVRAIASSPSLDRPSLLESLAANCDDLVVTGLPGVGKSVEVGRLAAARGRCQVTLDLARFVKSPLKVVQEVCRGLRRDIRLFSTLLHLRTSGESQLTGLLSGTVRTAADRADSPESSEAESLSEVVRLLGDVVGRCVNVIETDVARETAVDLVCRQSRFHVVDIPLADTEARIEHWSSVLANNDADDRALASPLASAFRLSHGQIEAAARQATFAGGGQESYWRAAAAIAASGLQGIADRITPQVNWQDLVLPAAELEQLRDLVRRVRYREVVLRDWGFAQRLSYGTGINALFAGAPGTGKTMAAEVLAAQLRIPLFRVDCAAVISKYIGETEKNLERVFRAAERCDVVLLFDEADALFGKRTQVNDAHDRYANIETSYLLQRIERHAGIVVLATNLMANIDQAFIRRLTQIIHFRAPDADARERIWRQIWPTNLPLADDLVEQLPAIARHYDLNGGGIKNAALTAAYLVADSGDERALQLAHVLRAIEHEYRKLGRSCEKFAPRSIPSVTARRTGVGA